MGPHLFLDSYHCGKFYFFIFIQKWTILKKYTAKSDSNNSP